MDRSIEGYVFRCKICGEEHILTGKIPRKGIRISCAWDKNQIETYERSDFKKRTYSIGMNIPPETFKAKE